jgi:type II secretory pathway component GspD/PulD (secretin)
MLRTPLLSGALGLTICLSALSADEPAKPDTKPETKTDPSASIEVYRLKNADLNDAQQAFTALTGRTRRTGTPTGKGGLGGPKGGGGFTRPTPDDPFTPDVAPVNPAPGVVARALADPRTRSLIVRGTEKDQQLAADLVAVLDAPEGKPLPAVKALKAFRLQHIDANDLASMLQQLDPRMGYRLAPVGSMKLLLATGTDEQMKELTDAVKKLDIPAETK